MAAGFPLQTGSAAGFNLFFPPETKGNCFRPEAEIIEGCRAE